MEGGEMTPEIDAAELYYDGLTGFVPIEDARKVERKLNDALKENARLRPALMGFSQAEELMELREDLRKQLRCSLDLARQNNILQDYNKILGQDLQDTKQELEEAHREIAKLKASSNENYWELSRQRGNMLFALHKIADAVRYGFKHGSKSGEEVK
jgi:hypothetical protein